MPVIDPKWAFYIGLVLCITQVIDTGGTTLLQGAIPAAAIGIIVAWCSIITKIGVAVITYVTGTNMTTSSRLASAASVDGVKSIQVDPKIAEVAAAAVAGNAAITTTKGN